MIDNVHEMKPSFLAYGGSETASELAATVHIYTALPGHTGDQCSFKFGGNKSTANVGIFLLYFFPFSDSSNFR